MKKTIIALLGACLLGGTSQGAILVSVGAPGDYPASGATLTTVTQAQSVEFYDTLGNTSATELQLAQTFQLSSTITLDSITVSADDIEGGVTVGIGIFEVADTNAGSLSFSSGNLLTTQTFTFSATQNSPSTITFDFTGADEITLNGSVGTEGFALAFTASPAISGGYFDWGRTAGTGSGPVYPDGIGYDDSGAVTGDFGLSIVAVPEPTSAAMFVGAMGLLLIRRRHYR